MTFLAQCGLMLVAFNLLLVAAIVVDELLDTRRTNKARQNSARDLQARLEEDYEVALLESWWEAT